MQILVTGARGGIGSEIVTALSTAGANVVPAGREDADLATYEGVKKLEEKVSPSSPFDWIICAHGFIDDPKDLEDKDPMMIRAVFDINILSCIYISQAFLKLLRPQGGIIFVSSTSGLWGNGNWPVYSASKAALNIFSQALARHRPNFKFVTVCPGPTTTAMLEKSAGPDAQGQDPRLVADLIASIVSGAPEYKTGDVVSIRGGETKIVSRIE